MTTYQLRNLILETFKEVAEQNQLTLVETITDDSMLLEIGLDSIGFATVITMLELKLDYDPFLLMEEPAYPNTFAEFLKVYDHFKDHAK